MRPLLATLLLAAALPAWAGPRTRPPARGTRAAPTRQEDPAAPVREAYRLDRAFLDEAKATPLAPQRKNEVPWAPPHRARLFTKQLAALLETDSRYSQKTGQVGALDGDPLFDAQELEDGVFDTLTVNLTERRGDRAEVLARFNNYALREMRFIVVREGGRWAIDDILTTGEGADSLAALLAQPHFCAKGWTGPCREE